MKNKIGFITGAVLLGIVLSCSDSFLDTKPYGVVTQSTLTATPTGANSLLIAAYSNLDGFSGWDNGTPWGGAASNWTFGSVAGGDAYKGSEANDQPDVTPIEKHTTTPTNPYVEGKWRNYYDGIQRANAALNAFNELPAAAITTEERNKRIAEAKFLRGFYHWELRKVFGKVPYIDEKTVDVRVGNAEDILPKIQQDFSDAITDLPTVNDAKGRATKGAAQSMLGITKMWEGKWAEAKALFDTVIASKVYDLNPKYHDNFDPAVRDSQESIIEVQQTANDGSGNTDNGNNGDVLNFPYGGGPGGCCGFHQPSQNLVNAFQTDGSGLPLLDTYNQTDVKSDDGIKSTDPFTTSTANLDPRLDWTVGRRGIPYLDWGPHPGRDWIRDQTYAGPYSPIKNTYPKSLEGIASSTTGWTKGYNNNNTKLLRYADLLLYAAEAEVELGNLNTALTYVNKIRTRAANKAGWVYTAGGTLAANYVIGTYAIFADQATARKAVRFERRLELGMEGHRFFDLVRWGVADTEKNAYFAKESIKRTYLSGATFKKGVNEVFPIPQQAILLSSKGGQATLTQNNGY
jgi:hypothetical protein